MSLALTNNLSRGLSVTEFGTQLTVLGKLSRFSDMERSSLIKYVAAKAITVLALTAPVTLLGMTLAVKGWSIINSTLSNSRKTLFLAIFSLAMTGGAEMLGSIIRSFSITQKSQREEKEVINALGGYEKFNALPVLTAHQVGRKTTLQEYNQIMLRNGGSPIAKGVDEWNRPFVALHVQDKSTGDKRVVIHFQNSMLTIREVVPSYFESSENNFGDLCHQIRQLENDTHPTFTFNSQA